MSAASRSASVFEVSNGAVGISSLGEQTRPLGIQRVASDLPLVPKLQCNNAWHQCLVCPGSLPGRSRYRLEVCHLRNQSRRFGEALPLRSAVRFERHRDDKRGSALWPLYHDFCTHLFGQDLDHASAKAGGSFEAEVGR